MDEECEQYEVRNRAITEDVLCIHFTGDKKDNLQLMKCRKHCSYYDCLQAMKGPEPLARRRRAYVQIRRY